MATVPEGIATEVADIVESRVGFTIPWELIIPILIELLEECFPTSDSLIDAAVNPTDFQLWALRRKAIQRLRGCPFRGHELRQAANAFCDAVLDVASRTPAKALSQMVD